MLLQCHLNTTNKQCLSQQLPGIPEYFFEICDCILFNPMAFLLKQLLHQARMAKMIFSGELAIAVYNPVRRDIQSTTMRLVQRPANHAR
ncbi:MAG: hypothetical protein PWQ54_956 [Bacteroidales bacterium]|nr:hypothetical protein [Bacteroidales bacterium]